MTRLIQQALVTTLAVAIAAFSGVAGAQELGIATGARAPSAVVRTLDGKSVDLGAWVGKTPMLIEFWAHWCPNCKDLEPKLIALHRKYGAGVKFINVAVSVNQTPARVKAYTERYKYRHETFFDAEGKATEAYDVPATSYIVIVDRKGEVIYTGLGGKQDLEPAILKAMK